MLSFNYRFLRCYISEVAISCSDGVRVSTKSPYFSSNVKTTKHTHTHTFSSLPFIDSPISIAIRNHKTPSQVCLSLNAWLVGS
ncbi:hypothetical protein RJT34_17738 [Clitoria ternatea]|uniref:Uncharacterized protein n=1 Tax=Clitoria ternatea TaxID=43366 RepID=A0AAN9JB19_CLITE